MVATPVVVSLLAGGLWISHWHQVGGGYIDPVKAKELDVVLGMISVDEYLESHRKAYFMIASAQATGNPISSEIAVTRPETMKVLAKILR